MDKYLKLRDGIKLRYKKNLIENPKAVILINHGFAEHFDRYDYVTSFFNNCGYSIYRYDLRGHGKTKSKKGHMDSYMDLVEDCDEMVKMIKKENKKLPIYMLGHSMGGFITCLYGIYYPKNLEGQIFSGPAVNSLPKSKGINGVLLRIISSINKKIKIPNMVEDDICSVDKVVIDYKEDPLVLEKATSGFLREFLIEGVKDINKNIHKYKYPCLITHGSEDKIVPKEIGIYLYENISSSDKEIKIYDDLYHEILNEKERDNVLKDMVSWLDQRV